MLYKSGKFRLRKKTSIYYGWYVIAVSWLMTFIVTGTSVGVFFKPILDEFGWDRATLSLVSSVVIIIFAVLTPFIGRIIDRVGPKVILFVTAVFQISSSIFNAIAGGLFLISIGRFLYEMKPTHATQVLSNRWFVEQRGKALGILSTGTPLGTLALAPLSQYLIIAWGWRETMLFWALVMAAIGVPLLFLIKNKPEDARLPADGSGGAMATPVQNRSTSAVKVAAAEPGYGLREIFKYRSFWLLSATQLFCGISCGLIGAHIVIFATDLGYSALIGASFLSVQGIMSLLGVLVTGSLSDRFPRKNVLSMTHLVRGTSFVILVTTISFFSNSLPMLYVAMVLFGFGWFTTAPLSAGLVANLFGFLRMGTVIGIILACHSIGMAIGTFAGGLSYQLTYSYGPIFLVCAILEISAAVFAWMTRGTVSEVK